MAVNLVLVELFDFDLPEELIALYPSYPRHSSRLMRVAPSNSTKVTHDHFVNLPQLLAKGDLLVFNDTKVIPAALSAKRLGRGDSSPKITVNLHKRLDKSRWLAFVRPARKLQQGDVLNFEGDQSGLILEASIAEKKDAGEVLLNFALDGVELDNIINQLGSMPLPPYILSKRAVSEDDSTNYQTVFAKNPGAVAAPTAGLHFDEDLLKQIEDAGVGSVYTTLHVGAGTFLPVKSDDTDHHAMHSEWGRISAETAAAINQCKQSGGRVVAVGTTAMRLLESATDGDGTIHPFEDETDIFITPGYRFKIVDLLITNFHLPKSTLFMLVSAFSGLELMQQAYKEAIENDYKFYSYGDATLLEKAE